MSEITPVTGLEEPPARARPHLPRLRVGRVIGLVLVVGATALMGMALWKLLHTGTCASGGPYVSANPCPNGTVVWALTIPAAMLLWFAGMALMGRLLVPWAILFTGVGATLIAAGLVGDLGPGGGSAAWTVGPLFVLMGAPVGIWALIDWLRERGEPPATATGGWLPPVAGAWLSEQPPHAKR